MKRLSIVFCAFFLIGCSTVKEGRVEYSAPHVRSTYSECLELEEAQRRADAYNTNNRRSSAIATKAVVVPCE